MPGFRLGQKWKDKLGMRASFTAELVFEGVRVPVENRLGEEGAGTLAMMRNLEIERLTLAAMSLGIAQRCLERDGRLGQPAQELRRADPRARPDPALHRRELRRVARGPLPRLRHRAPLRPRARAGQRIDADAAKLFASQVGKRAADAAIQVLGGYGYMGENVVERLWRDAKLLEIGGGTLEAHHKNLTRDLTQRSGAAEGLIRPPQSRGGGSPGGRAVFSSSAQRA